jgi:hypothetical protein
VIDSITEQRERGGRLEKEGKFRILSIDGGGVRGFLAAAILANVESYLDIHTGVPMPLGRRFDLVAGTSAGGLIALGLASGRTAAELRRLFFDLIPKVFGVTNRRWRLNRIFRPKYGSEPLRAQLQAFFGQQTLGDLGTDVCIVSVALQDAKPRLYKTDYLVRNVGRLDEMLTDIAMATTAAPTYFAAQSSKYSAAVIDGGVAANNPSMIALVDGLQFERASKRGTPKPDLGDDAGTPVVMLSIGTGEPGPMPYRYEQLVAGGIYDWARPIHEVILLSQAHLVHHQAAFLLKTRYHRINPLLNFPIELDDAARFHNLINKADITEANEKFLRNYF